MQKPKEAAFIHLRKKIPSPFTLIETKEKAQFTLFPPLGEQKENSFDSLSGKESGKINPNKKKDDKLGRQEKEMNTSAYEEGLQTGLKKGKEEGEKEALKKLSSLIESLKNYINQINHAQKTI